MVTRWTSQTKALIVDPNESSPAKSLRLYNVKTLLLVRHKLPFVEFALRTRPPHNTALQNS